MIMNVLTQNTKEGLEMLLYNDQGLVEVVLFDSSDLTNGINTEEGNAPSKVDVIRSETISATQIVQCVECNKYVQKIRTVGASDEEQCIDCN